MQRRQHQLALLSGTDKEVSLQDLSISRGAIVTGTTGMGKSNLRFHLIAYFQSLGFQILDLDLKGEVKISNRLVPGINLAINLFQNRKISTIQVLHLIQTLAEDLTPPQISLLTQVLESEEQSNLQEFFNNIVVTGLANSSSGMGSPLTPTALLQKLRVLQDDFGTIFNVSSCSVSRESNEDLFFDLSHLFGRCDLDKIAQFVEFILHYFVISNPERRNMAIFLDESQLLLSKSSGKAVETVVTHFRSRNIPVFIFGTRADHFPDLVLDSSTVFLFQSMSKKFRETSNLPPFDCIYISPEISKARRLTTLSFRSTLIDPKLYPLPFKYLKRFDMTPTEMRKRIFNVLRTKYFPGAGDSVHQLESDWVSHLLLVVQKYPEAQRLAITGTILQYNRYLISSTMLEGDLTRYYSNLNSTFRKLRMTLITPLTQG
ncbi:MAG: hypothetical protein ACXAE3_14450 [Candidatus Kariarchaeaceae archaeon]|jgi:hypothetical protein